MQKLETISSIRGSYKLYIHFGSEKKKKKERPLKELYKCHSSNPFFLARRSHSLTTNTHHLNTHTHTGNKELVMTGTLHYAQTPTTQPKAKKKTVQHHCLQHSSQGLCTHPRLNQKKKKLFYQSSQGKSSAVICDRESHQKACLAVRHRHTLPRAGATAQFFLFYAELAGSRSGAGGLQIRIRLKQTKHLSRT